MSDASSPIDSAVPPAVAPPSAPARRASAPPPAPPVPSAPLLTLTDYLVQEPRLARRVEMRGAFVRACERAGLQRAPAAQFAALLSQLESGDL